jgi:hypothetical protein
MLICALPSVPLNSPSNINKLENMPLCNHCAKLSLPLISSGLSSEDYQIASNLRGLTISASTCPCVISSSKAWRTYGPKASGRASSKYSLGHRVHKVILWACVAGNARNLSLQKTMQKSGANRIILLIKAEFCRILNFIDSQTWRYGSTSWRHTRLES